MLLCNTQMLQGDKLIKSLIHMKDQLIVKNEKVAGLADYIMVTESNDLTLLK